MIKFIDLFAGIGGIRKGFEQACRSLGQEAQCVFTSEIKPAAIEVLRQNHPGESINGDITQVKASDIPQFDFLLAGFPCQAFSAAGKRQGFMDTRGTMFFEVERILKERRPYGFLLENVEGLVNHDKTDKKAPTGRTLSTILEHLDALGYKVTWGVLNAKDFGLAQDRKRVYIAGSLSVKPSFDNFEVSHGILRDILETGKSVVESEFTKALLDKYDIRELYGKSIKDKRGGPDNIHSWDLELKGAVTDRQKQLLNLLFKERRKKKWAVEYGIKWMDGMPLSLAQINTFFNDAHLEELLDDLVMKGYLKKEHPKKLVREEDSNGNVRQYRAQDKTLPLGYNIVTGKLSFEVNKILSPYDIAPTLVAMDMQKLFVPDVCGIRHLTLREGLRLFGYSEDFKFDVSVKDGYDLLGNTVAVPVVKAVSERVINDYITFAEKRRHENNS